MRKHLHHPLLLFSFLCFALSLGAQDEEQEVTIDASLSGSTYTISIDPRELPQLKSDGTGNDPYYSYYWEFGDQRFAHSNEPSVTHVYPSRLVGQDVEVRLHLKAHYALSPSIVREAHTRTLSVEAGEDDVPFEDVPAGNLWMSSSEFSPSLETDGEGEEGKTTHQIQQREDFVLVISVKPPEGQSLQGATLDVRISRYSNFFAYTGMGMDSSLIASEDQLEPGRRLPSRLTFSLNDFGSIEGTNLFLYLTPDLSGKNSALGKIIEVKATLEKDGRDIGESRLDLEVVKSRDPNRLLVADTWVEDWKGFFDAGLTYRVDFQNYGSGPVENGIAVRVELPKGADPESLTLLGYHSAACSSIRPGLSPCDTIINRNSGKREVIINLDDAGLTSRDADERESKGFITYNIKPRRGIGKCRWKSQAWVQFTSARREEKTNRVSSSFKPSFSLGLKAMYNYFPEGNGTNYNSVGLELGNDKHCGWDPRLSVMFGFEEFANLSQGLDKYYLDFALTPFRVDLIRAGNGKWNFLGIGVGGQFSLILFNDQDQQGGTTKPGQKWTGFGDLVILSKRKGPRIGAQFHVPIAVNIDESIENIQPDFDPDNYHMQFYLTWAF